MAINLTTKFLPYVDEQFNAESKRSLITNNDFDFDGAHTVKVYKISTAQMNDYDRNGSSTATVFGSRFGNIENLEAVTEEMTLSRDRSFTFTIDKLDEDETGRQLQAASALSRQNKEIVIPEVDAYTYGVMCTKAGTVAEAVEITAENVYDLILQGSKTLDDALVPETSRVILVTPKVYAQMKKSGDIIMETDIGSDMRKKGVIGMLDGCSVIKVPAVRLPSDFGFMVVHPCATVAPVKLEDFRIHRDPPGISGALVEGRICYDAFVFENKAKAIYLQKMA